MPDPAQLAQAQALEVPVIIQGAQTVPGTDRRELFSENAKTTLVMENGAVLTLQSKVVVGQAIFVHNQLNGREILCRVLETPAEGQTGYTDLEFTSADREFWVVPARQPETGAQGPDVAAEKPETLARPVETAALKPQTETQAPHAVAEKPETAAQSETPGEDSLAMMSASASKTVAPPLNAPATESSGPRREELVPAHEMVPETAVAPAETPPSTEATEPTGEQIDAALRKMSNLSPASSPSPAFNGQGDAPAYPHDTAEHDAKFMEKLAALMARDVKRAKYASTKEKGPQAQGEAASENAPQGAEEASEAEASVPKVSLSERLTTGRNAVIVEIAACVVITVALGFIWHAVRGVFIHPSDQPSVTVASSKQKKPEAGPKPAATPTATVAAATTRVAAPSKQTRVRVERAPAAQNPSVSAVAGGPTVAKVDRPSLVPGGPALATNRDVATSESVDEQAKPPKTIEPHSPVIIPARIISQPQPALPPWAKPLDLDGVVTLDALIDEKGDVKETRVLSGPRALQRSAEQAIQLWLFVPAQLDGRPVSTHMVLTVEFQR